MQLHAIPGKITSHDRLVLGDAQHLSMLVFSCDQRPHVFDEVRKLAHLHSQYVYELVGCYKGKVEVSWAMPMYAWNNNTTLRQLVMNTEESLLVLEPTVHGSRTAALHMIKANTFKDIGEFVPVSYEDAAQSDAWTMDPVTCTWYACR